MATETSPLFSAQPVPYSLSSHVTNPRSLEAAVDAAAEFLNQVGHPPLGKCTVCGAILASFVRFGVLNELFLVLKGAVNYTNH